MTDSERTLLFQYLIALALSEGNDQEAEEYQRALTDKQYATQLLGLGDV